MKTLNLKKTEPTSQFPSGSFIPGPDADNNQILAMIHFSGGTVISSERLDDVTFVAEIHGWEVVADTNFG